MDILITFLILSVLALYIYLCVKRPGFALLSYIPVAIFLYVLAIAWSDNYVFEMAVIVAISVAVILFLTVPFIVWFAGGDRYRSHWKRQIAKFLSITLLGIGILFLFVVFGFNVYASFILILFIISLIAFIKSAKHSNNTYILTTLGASIRQNLPLPAALRSAAQGQSYFRATTLKRIADFMTQGFSVSESLRKGYLQCPSDILGLVASAEAINQLPNAFESIQKDMTYKAQQSRVPKPTQPVAYFLTIFLFANIMIAGLMLFVMPKFHAVIQEMYAGTLPWQTRALMAYSNFLFFKTWGLIPLTFTFIVATWILLDLKTKFRPRRYDKPFWTSKVADFFKWHIPILHWFEMNSSMTQLVELLRASLTAGLPMDEAFENSLTLDVNDCFRNKLIKVLRKIKQGENLSQAITKSKLSKTLAWAMDDNINRDNIPAVLEVLERFYRNNYSYRINLMKYTLSPMIVIALGCGVCFVCLAVFLPMIDIITHLTDLVP